MSDEPNKIRFKIKNNLSDIPTSVLNELEGKIIKISKSNITKTKSGSIKYLLFGEQKSLQSINIKMGKIIGEDLPKSLINTSNQVLQDCGILELHNCTKKKDFDLIWIKKKKSKNEKKGTVYYRECKGNMDLDTEKLPATIEKVKALKIELTKKYPEFEIDAGIFNWTIYEREDAVGGLTKINTCEGNDVTVDHFKDFLEILEYKWSKEEYTVYFRKLGNILTNIE